MSRPRNVSEDEDELPEIPPELLRRETSRRKAKDNLKSKIEAQEMLLMDENDPTFNNPALDLEDSDDDAEWNPLKDAEKSGKKRKHGHESSDEDEEDYSEFNNLHNFNKKRQQEAKRRRESSSDNHVPESGEDFKVECLLKKLLPKVQDICRLCLLLILTKYFPGWHIPDIKERRCRGVRQQAPGAVAGGRQDADPEVREH